MIRKRIALFCGAALLSGISLRGFAQERITIEQCQQWALENYPVIRQHGLLDEAEKYTLSNIARVYRPEFSLSGSASWQSEKTELDMDLGEVDVNVDLSQIATGLDLPSVNIPISVPNLSVPVSDQDRYNVSLSLRQALWLGGRNKASKEIARRETDMLHAGLDAQLYKIKDKVKQLYFGLLTLQGRDEQLDRAEEILDSVRLRAEVALKEGLIYETDLDVLDGERIKYEQLRIELEAKRKACLEGVDALITNLRGVCIGVSTADCIPILCYDATCGIVAAIHAGWRSTVGRIVRSTIAQMQSIFGSQPANIRAVICPGISVDAFEVGDEVYENFAHHGFPMEQLAVRYPAKDGSGEKWHIDLWEANRLQLLESGVPSGQISCSGICTYTHSDKFFSARKLGIASGRIFNGILLSP